MHTYEDDYKKVLNSFPLNIYISVTSVVNSKAVPCLYVFDPCTSRVKFLCSSCRLPTSSHPCFQYVVLGAAELRILPAQPVRCVRHILVYHKYFLRPATDMWVFHEDCDAAANSWHSNDQLNIH